jgi:hypothetical protein
MSGSRIGALTLAASALLWLASPARAELVDAQGNAPGIAAAAPVFEDVGFITGNATTSTAFSITAAGTYTVTLTDFAFPDAFQSLALAITSATATLATLDAPGTIDFVLNGPAQLFALVYGAPNLNTGVGLYGLRVALADNGGGNQVPLPASLWLLASAVASALLGQRRRIGAR